MYDVRTCSDMSGHVLVRGPPSAARDLVRLKNHQPLKGVAGMVASLLSNPLDSLRPNEYQIRRKQGKHWQLGYASYCMHLSLTPWTVGTRFSLADRCVVQLFHLWYFFFPRAALMGARGEKRDE